MDDIRNHFVIEAIRPTMWEEHCLECSAPLCYKSCPHYIARSDGRCKRFENGYQVFEDERACCGQGAHVKFRQWADMMTIIFPGFMNAEAYRMLFDKNQRVGSRLEKVANSGLPTQLRWELIRTREYIRRRNLRKMSATATKPDAFIFHGFSYTQTTYSLIMEIFDDDTPLYRTSLQIHLGENLYILNCEQLSSECWTANYLVKVYPENNIEAEIDIYWCDFVQGKPISTEKPADKVKCVVWDLDNTIWDGTLIETDYPSRLKLRNGVLDTIQELDRRGIIQSIASKNDMEMAWPVVEGLGISEYFLYPQIHWNAKSGSMENIARDLNIGIDTLALIDDSKYEREQVHSVWKQVRVYDVSELPELLNKNEFSVMVTEESKKRRIMYRAEEKRNQLKNSGNDDTIAFLKKCNLQLEIFEPKSDTEITRCYELVVRTNQLNMSGKKYTREEFLDALQRPQHHNFAFSCRDDFGEYGIVGFGQYHVEKQTLVFTEFAMSCRVAGKFVESALFAQLLETEDCGQGVFHVLKTKKNSLLRRTLTDIGFSIKDENDKEISYRFDAELKERNLVSAERRK